MRKLLEDFYCGNLTPGVQKTVPDSELQRLIGNVAECETQLMERLDEPEKEILEELVNSQGLVNNMETMENFILGFRLGVRMMAECMDINDGNICGMLETE